MANARVLKVGDVVRIRGGMRIRTDVPKHFVYQNCEGDFTLTHETVTVGEVFGYLKGEYIVTKTKLEGGGTGHGPHDVFPDGHHVYCQAVANELTKIDFYQSGIFNCVIDPAEIQPIGKAVQKWTWEK